MGYYNRHFNKQLNRKGFHLINATVMNANKTEETIKIIVHRDNIKPRMTQADFATPKQYGTALSGR